MADRSDNVVGIRSGSWRSKLQRGMRAARRGDLRAAALAFTAALELAPDQAEVLIALGRHYLREERWEDAERLLRRAYEQDPWNVIAAALLARALGLHLKRREEAFTVLYDALQRSPDASVLHVVRGELLLADRAFVEARGAFIRVLDRDDSDEVARAGLARAYNMEGIALSGSARYEEAVFAFKRAADLASDWSAPAVNLGVAFARLGQFRRAIEAYRAALLHDHSNPVAIFNLALAYRELHDVENATDVAERLLAVCPDYPEARRLAANILLDRGDFDRAIALLLHEIEHSDQRGDLWSSLGLAYIGSGNVDRGEECLHRAVTLDPQHLTSYYNLALLYATQQRRDDAQSVLRRAFAIDPQRTRAAVQSRGSLAELGSIDGGPIRH